LQRIGLIVGATRINPKMGHIEPERAKRHGRGAARRRQ
jgi:hypothetical protein